jgi:F-type H+-transporting ATPase subunit gamma
LYLRERKLLKQIFFDTAKDKLIAETDAENPQYSIVQAIRDANASETRARMTAMDKASENAEDLIKSLRSPITGQGRQPHYRADRDR